MRIALSLLVIVFIIHQHRIGAIEQKRHAPVATDGDRPLAGAVPAELVEM
jgi:hypothetical protein